jgi:hypothetical protein
MGAIKDCCTYGHHEEEDRAITAPVHQATNKNCNNFLSERRRSEKKPKIIFP